MHIFAALLVLSLAACASLGAKGTISTIGPGIHSIQGTLPPTRQEAKKVRVQLIRQAKAFCEKEKHSIEVHNEDIIDPKTRAYRVVFQCLRGLSEDVGVGALTIPRPLAVYQQKVTPSKN